MIGRLASDRRALGIVVSVAVVTFLVLLFLGILPRLFSFTGTTKVRAAFASVGGLHVGEPVRIDGVTKGRVSRIDLHPAGKGATVELELERSAGKLYANAGADIRWRVVLGASYVVNVKRGTRGVGELGEKVIPEGRTSFQAELDEVTGALRAGARRGLRSLFHELPDALADPDQPGRLFDTLADHGQPIAEGLDTLRGRRRDEDLGRLITHVGRTMRALDAPQDRLRSLVQDAATTLDATAGRAQDIRAFLSVAADVMPHVRATLARVDETTTLANPLLARLRGPAAQVAPAVAALRPVVRDADRLLTRQAQPLLRSLRPAAGSLRTAARAGVPLVEELAPSLERIDSKILPDLRIVSPETKMPTYQIIGPAVAGLGATAAHYDDEATFMRLLGSGGGRVYDTLPCRAWLSDPNSSSYVQCQTIGDLLSRIFRPSPDRKGGAP